MRVDAAELRGHVEVVVGSSVDETLAALLQAEADGICVSAMPSASHENPWPAPLRRRASRYADLPLNALRGSVNAIRPRVHRRLDNCQQALARSVVARL